MRPGDTLAFESGYISGGEGTRFAVVLTKPPESTNRCTFPAGGVEQEVTIALRNLETGAESKLQDDRAIPESRGCPRG